MKTITKILIIGLATATVACQQSKLPFPAEKEIYGLATPVRLTPAETQVFLEDYFLNIQKIDSVSLTHPLKGHLSDDNRVLTIPEPQEKLNWLMTMKVWIDGYPWPLLIRKSSKIKYIFQFDPGENSYQSVNVAGEMNGWNPKAGPLEIKDGIWSTTWFLEPGKYQYQVVTDGQWKLDPNNSNTADNNIGGINSLLTVGESNAGKIPLLFTNSFSEGQIALHAENKPDEIFIFWQNFVIRDEMILKKDNNIVFSIPKEAREIERSWIRVWAFNRFGVSNDLLIPLSFGHVVGSSDQLTREDWEASVLYFMMIDRFNNGNPSNDHKVDDPQILPKVNYHGGDLAGITQKINDGYFTYLGINTIWLSPITQNPIEAYGYWPDPPTKFSGYHGYWPVSSSKVDFRYGTDSELKELIETAHKNNINIILDYVAHHVHELHPAYKNNPDWATDLYLPDGSMNTERWDEYRLTTWFDSFLPTFDLTQPEICDVMTDSALFWMKNYDMDGFRHDATKHIPEIFWRMLTKKLKEQVILPYDKRIYQVGETYGNRELIGSYINTGMMDAQFDFGVYDQALAVFAKTDEPFTKLSGSLQESLEFFGYHNLMGYITGNQDKPRFISLAGGDLKFSEDAKMAGWHRDIGVGDPVGYSKLQCLTAFNLTIPGIPTIYYGDEIGMPGANDPDNRRMMKFNDLSPNEEQTRNVVKKLVHMRRNNLALTFGDYRLLNVNETTLAFIRTYFDRIAVVVFNKDIQPATIELGLPEGYDLNNLNAQFDSEFTTERNKVKITVKGNSFEVLLN